MTKKYGHRHETKAEKIISQLFFCLDNTREDEIS